MISCPLSVVASAWGYVGGCRVIMPPPLNQLRTDNVCIQHKSPHPSNPILHIQAPLIEAHNNNDKALGDGSRRNLEPNTFPSGKNAIGESKR
uniref:Uncharacterized protein n=1 Tax=Ditylenchus dipsaci TaxID=166011 RepID=A0A915E2Z1_9BILA